VKKTVSQKNGFSHHMLTSNKKRVTFSPNVCKCCFSTFFLQTRFDVYETWSRTLINLNLSCSRRWWSFVFQIDIWWSSVTDQWSWMRWNNAWALDWPGSRNAFWGSNGRWRERQNISRHSFYPSFYIFTRESSYCFQRIWASKFCLSVCPSVRLSHGRISQKRCKLGSPNLHRRLPGRL